MDKEEKCEPSDLCYLSNPPQNKCKKCGQFWVVRKEIPMCKMVEINTIFPPSWEEKNHTCSEEDCTESNCPYIAKKREKGCDGKCAPDECVCSSISWEEKKREAWHKMLHDGHHTGHDGIDLNGDEIADYWIERMKAVREETYDKCVSEITPMIRSQALEEAKERIQQMIRPSMDDRWENGYRTAIEKSIHILQQLKDK